MTRFVDRQWELRELDELLAAQGAQFVVVYGRRRVGKTTLLLHWAQQTQRPYLYWVARRETAEARETLLDAATLAVHFSQLRKAGGGPVAYCARKHVVKPRGAQPGSVLYSQNKLLHVDVDPARLDRLLRRND